VPLPVLILVASILLAGRGEEGAVEPAACAATLLVGTLGPLLGLARAVRRTTGSSAAAERWGRLVPWGGALATALAAHRFGWVTLVRRGIGDWPGVDEAVAALPALAALAVAAWIRWPLEVRLRNARLVERLEAGLPPPEVPSRFRGTLASLRGGLGLVLVPLLAVVAATEAAEMLAGAVRPEPARSVALAVLPLVALAATVIVLPLLLRPTLGLRDLPAGEVRDEVERALADAGVGVRAACVWPTGGMLANAAVLGFVRPLRYLLLSDLLLAALPREELRAVIEHELGHVRRHHLPWLAATLVATLLAGSIALGPPLAFLAVALPESLRSAADLAVPVAFMAGTLVVLGWVSRRFEGEADACAAVALARRDGAGRVSAESVAVACAALERVARLGQVDPRRPSWRHGSIRWRQRNLATLVGRRFGDLPVERTLRRVRIAVAATLVAGGTIVLVLVGIDAWASRYDAVAAFRPSPSGPLEPSACVS